jgi:hypothetical protein
MNGTIREFTKKEFDVFVVKNGYETFTADQVLKFNQEVVNNRESMDEFSKSCAAADFVSLNRAIVVDDDLVKSVVYYRECQIEPLEKEEFGSIMKSKQIVFADTALNRFKGIVGLPVDNDVIEKARKAEPIGTEKTYGGKLYIKTEKGWRLKPKGPSTKKNESKKEAPLLRQVTAAQYKDRKDEIIGEISKERLNLMNKYGDNWQDDASPKDLERLSSLVSCVNKLGENFNQFGDKSKNSSEHQMTEAQMRAYATVRDPKAKEIAKEPSKEKEIGKVVKEHLGNKSKYFEIHERNDGKVLVRPNLNIDESLDETKWFRGGMAQFVQDMRKKGFKATPNYSTDIVTIYEKPKKQDNSTSEERAVKLNDLKAKLKEAKKMLENVTNNPTLSLGEASRKGAISLNKRRVTSLENQIAKLEEKK